MSPADASLRAALRQRRAMQRFFCFMLFFPRRQCAMRHARFITRAYLRRAHDADVAISLSPPPDFARHFCLAIDIDAYAYAFFMPDCHFAH